jgi:hypothetical protein
MHDERNIRTITRSSHPGACCRRVTRAAVAANNRRDDNKPAYDFGIYHDVAINQPRHITLDDITLDHNNDHNVHLDRAFLDRAHLNGARAFGRLRPELRGPG